MSGDRVDLVPVAKSAVATGRLYLDVDLTASIGDDVASVVTLDDGTLAVDVPAGIAGRRSTIPAKQQLRLIRRLVAVTGQGLRVAIDGRPAVAVFPRRRSDGSCRASIKILHWRPVVGTVWRRWFGRD